MNDHERSVAAQKLKRNYEHLVFNRLGNWKKAWRKFGVKFDALAVYPYATKEDVLYGLREWGQKGLRGTLMHAAYRLFGSWGGGK